MFTINEKIEFVRAALGDFDHDRAFMNVAVVCPACRIDHGSRKKKLVIRISDDMWHCWVCGLRGRSLIPLLKKYSSEFLSEYVAKFKSCSSTIDDVADGVAPDVIALPDGFRMLAIDCSGRLAEQALSYLASRSLTKRDLWRFKIGVASSLPGRIVIPSFDHDGRLNYHLSRRIDGVNYKKYVNCSVPSSSIIFNEHEIDWNDQINIVEGPFDVFKCPDNTIPLLGSTLSEMSLLFDRILENGTSVVLLLDFDAKKKMNAIAKLLSFYGIDVHVAMLQKGKDPGSMSRKAITDAIANAQVWNKNVELLSRIEQII